MGVNQWGPWVVIASGAGWLLIPLILCFAIIRINRRLGATFSRLTPHHRELLRQHLGPDRMPPFPVFSDIGWKLPAVAAAHFVAGGVWLACG